MAGGMNLTFTFLGSGTSYGVPMVGCHCPVCTSTDSRDRRLRAAAWIHDRDHSIIIDVGPDLREQSIREDICMVDAVFITHHHADHLNGLDDLRGFTRLSHKALPLYAQKEDLDFIKRNFRYIFDDMDFMLGWGIPRLQALEARLEPIDVNGVVVQPVPIMHGHNRALGYRIGNMAYLTDCSGIPQDSACLLNGLEIIVIDGLRWRPHPTHFSIDQAIQAARQFAPKKIYLTHLTHDIHHAADEKKLPEGVFFAYDGLSFEVSTK